MTNFFVPWWNWNHARDLINRWVFNGCGKPIIVRSSQQLILPWYHAIFTPISTTKRVIWDILWARKEPKIINFAWIMQTSEWVPNIHCLFWPWKNQDLKAIVTDIKNDFSRKVENNLRELSIKIIELSPEEHDKKMAIIQALPHFCEILLYLFFEKNAEVKTLLNWWNTKPNIIIEMIKYNIFFEEIFNELNTYLKLWTDIADIFIYLSEKFLQKWDKEMFQTPNFKIVFDFFIHNHGFYLTDWIKNIDYIIKLYQEKLN